MVWVGVRGDKMAITCHAAPEMPHLRINYLEHDFWVVSDY